MDPPTQRMATLEPIGQVQWTRRRGKDTAMVVGRQRLEGAIFQNTAERHKAG
jgi:hypothetical protein